MSRSAESSSEEEDSKLESLPLSPTISVKLRRHQISQKDKDRGKIQVISLVSQYQLKLDEAEQKHPNLSEASQVSAQEFDTTYVRPVDASPS